jgi:excisionase family DNA binding protein
MKKTTKPPLDPNEQITTRQAAEELGVSLMRVRQLIAAGRLPAEQFASVYRIRRGDLARVTHRPPGRRPRGVPLGEWRGRTQESPKRAA